MTKQNNKTFLELLSYLKNKILIILGITLFSTLIAFLISNYAIPKKYIAVSSIYVLNRASDDKINGSDFQTSTELLNDYKVLIKGKNVTTKVIEELNLDMSPETLSNNIEVTSEKGTRVLLIKVSDTDNKRATDIANTIWKEAKLQLENIMNVEAVNLVYEATVPTSPSSPNVTMNTIIGLLVGLVLVVLIFTIIFMADNRIKKEEDVENYLEIPTLGNIPYLDSIDKNKKSKFSKKIKR